MRFGSLVCDPAATDFSEKLNELLDTLQRDVTTALIRIEKGKIPTKPDVRVPATFNPRGVDNETVRPRPALWHEATQIAELWDPYKVRILVHESHFRALDDPSVRALPIQERVRALNALFACVSGARDEPWPFQIKIETFIELGAKKTEFEDPFEESDVPIEKLAEVAIVVHQKGAGHTHAPRGHLHIDVLEDDKSPKVKVTARGGYARCLMKINPSQRKQYGLETVLHLIPAVLHIKGWLRSTHEPAMHLNEELSLGFIDYLTNSTFGDHHNSTRNSRRGFVVSHNVQDSIGTGRWDERPHPRIVPSNKGNFLAEMSNLWRPLNGWGPDSFLLQEVSAKSVRVLTENYIRNNLSALVYSCLCILDRNYRSFDKGLYQQQKKKEKGLNEVRRLEWWKKDIARVLKNPNPEPIPLVPNLEKVGFKRRQLEYCKVVFAETEKINAAKAILEFVQREMRLFDRLLEASHFALHPKDDEDTFENGLKTSFEYTKAGRNRVLGASRALSEMASLGLETAFCELDDLVVNRAYVRMLKKADAEAKKSDVLRRLFLMQRRGG